MFAGEDNKKLEKIKAKIYCEKPNNAIHKFEGFMEVNGKKVSLGADNLLLRGCKLRNTPYVYGLVVFTGPETKIMKNAAKAKYKFSTLEIMNNQAIALVLIT